VQALEKRVSQMKDLELQRSERVETIGLAA
jgi:hypothetical protein